MATLTLSTDFRLRHAGERIPTRSRAFERPQEATVTFLPFQILYFEDLSVGMTETHSTPRLSNRQMWLDLQKLRETGTQFISRSTLQRKLRSKVVSLTAFTLPALSQP